MFDLVPVRKTDDPARYVFSCFLFVYKTWLSVAVWVSEACLAYKVSPSIVNTLMYSRFLTSFLGVSIVLYPQLPI